jgi:hypothetical protein
VEKVRPNIPVGFNLKARADLPLDAASGAGIEFDTMKELGLSFAYRSII